jgi:AcrR family transcriptional regulator
MRQIGAALRRALLAPLIQTDSTGAMAEQDSRVEDGRVARRLENRSRILDALFALIRAGRPHPTLREIAAKAGVTSRTLLNHYPDVGTLLLAAAARGRDFAYSELPVVSDHSNPETRVREFFRGAVNFYEAYSAVRWAVLTFPGELAKLDTRQTKGVVLSLVESRVAELLSGFGVTLDKDKQLRQAVLVAIDPMAWRLLRVQQRISKADAAETMARTLLALARDAKASQRSRS